MQDISFKRITILISTWLFGWVLVFVSPVGSLLETELARKVDYRVRADLGLEERVHQKLKILAYDDSSAAFLKLADLTAGRWAEFFEALAPRRPKAVFIDAAFGLQFSDRQNVPRLRAALSKLPVIGGSLWSAKRLMGRTPWLVEQPGNDLRRLTRPRGEVGIPVPDWLSIHSGFIYGPEEGLTKGFRGVGHIMRSQGWRVDPFLRVHERWAIPYAPLLLADDLKMDDDGVYVNKKRVGLDGRSRIVANLLSVASFEAAVRPMSLVIRPEGSHVDRHTVNTGDVLLILPAHYAGRIASEDSPEGPVPEGLVYASVLNSVLTGKWLTPLVPDQFGRIALAGLLSLFGVVLGLFGTRKLFIVGLIVGGVGLPISSIMAFTFGGYIIPWFTMTFVFVGAAMTTYVDRVLARNRRMTIAAASLKQHLPPERIPEFLSQLGVGMEAKTETVTVMFLDVVGFSIIAEDQRPAEVFGYLKEFSNDLRHVIYRHGGVVNKSLGDGLLAVFGLAGGHKDGADDDALKCAIELQEICYARCVSASNAGRPLFPLRIGLNTAPVHVGNLGDGDFIDFTVVGDGVNLASRLESSADYFKILMGASVHKRLKTFDAAGTPEIRRRLVKIKHHDDLVEAYEYDPFATRPEVIARLLDIYWRSIGVSRAVPRDEVALARTVAVMSTVAKGTLRNYSRGGLGMELDRFLARGVVISLDVRDPALRKRLDEKALGVVMVEIRWGRPTATGFLHGASFVGMSDEQKNFLFDAFKDAVGTRVSDVAA